MKLLHLTIVALAGIISTSAMAAEGLECVGNSLNRDPDVAVYIEGFGSKGEEADRLLVQKASSKIQEIAAECQAKHGGWLPDRHAAAIGYGEALVHLAFAKRLFKYEDGRGLTSSEAAGIVSALKKEYEEPKDSWLRNMVIKIIQGVGIRPEDKSKLVSLIGKTIPLSNNEKFDEASRLTDIWLAIAFNLEKFSTR